MMETTDLAVLKMFLAVTCRVSWLLNLICCLSLSFAQVEQSVILAHRNILVINSEYFRSMFRDGFHETHCKEITIPPEIVDGFSAEALVEFMYTGHLSG